MRAKDLIPILAECFAVPHEKAETIDRVLAQNGLRQRNRGRSWPEMTRREAMIFLLACMTAEKATKAHEAAAYWSGFKWLNLQQERGALEKGLDKGDEFKHVLNIPMYCEELRPTAEALAGEGAEVSMVDYLCALAGFLATPRIGGNAVRLYIENYGGVAQVNYSGSGIFGEGDEIHSDVFLPASGRPKQNDCDLHTAIHRPTYCYGSALVEIANRTADPLEAENA